MQQICMWSNIPGGKYMSTFGHTSFLQKPIQSLVASAARVRWGIHQVREAKICGHIAIYTTFNLAGVGRPSLHSSLWLQEEFHALPVTSFLFLFLTILSRLQCHRPSYDLPQKATEWILAFWETTKNSWLYSRDILVLSPNIFYMPISIYCGA